MMGQLFVPNTELMYPAGSFPKFQDLLAYWKVDEGASITVADSVGSNDGTLNTASWNGSGVVGSDAFLGDGSNYASLGVGNNILSVPADTFALAAWLDVTTVAANKIILDLGWQASGSTNSLNRGINFFVSNVGEVWVSVRDNSTAGYNGGSSSFWKTGVTVSTGKNLVIVNRNSSGAECYCITPGGETSNTLSTSLPNMTNWNSRDNFIFARYGGSTASGATPDIYTASGEVIDDIGVWGANLDESDRAALWNGGSGIQPLAA